MEHQDRREILKDIAQRLYHNEQPKSEQILNLLMQRLYCENKTISKKFATKLVKRLFVTTMEVKIPLMERIVRRYYKDKKGEMQYEEKKIKEIVSSDKKDGDIWSTGSKQLISHAGIKKIADFAEVTFTSPEIIDRPNSNNRKGFYLVVGASSPNRVPTYEVGSAHDENAKNKISDEFRFEMAHKRAMDRALLSHLGFHDIYSSEESDAWSTEENLKLQLSQKNNQIKQITNEGNRTRNEMKVENEKLKAEIATLRQDVERRSVFIDKLLSYVALPANDEKYPNQYLSTIVERKDYEYMQGLTKNNDKTIRYAAIRLLKLDAMHIEEQEAKRQKEQEIEKNEQSQGPIKEQIKINQQIIAPRKEPVKQEYQEIKPLPPEITSQPLAASVEAESLVHQEKSPEEEITATQEVESMQQTAPSILQSKPFTMTPIEPEEKPKEFEHVDFTLEDH